MENLLTAFRDEVLACLTFAPEGKKHVHNQPLLLNQMQWCLVGALVMWEMALRA